MTSGGRAPYNPYAAPVAPAPEPSSARTTGLAIKWFYLGVSVVIVALSEVLSSSAASTATARAGMYTCFKSATYLQIILAVAWIHAAWRGIPARLRAISPGLAVGRFFIPVYNCFWLFVVAPRTSRALDDVLVAAEDPRRAPRELAIAASVAQFAMYVAINVLRNPAPWAEGIVRATTSGLWFAFAFFCDRTRRAVAEVAPRVPDGVGRPTKSVGSGWMAIAIPVFGLLVLLAVWQFLSPTTVIKGH